MLHVRVMSPAEATGRLVEALASEPGVRNLAAVRGAGHRPGGDVVEFDVRQGAANPVFRLLRQLRLDRPGAVTVERVDTILTGPPAPRGEVGSPRREVTPVWELVESTIHANAAYAPSFFILLIIAALIASVGLLTNSQILIVAAMVVGPEYAAIIAVALAVSHRDRSRISEGLVALALGFAAAIVFTFAFTLLVRAGGEVPSPFTVGVRPVASLVAAPGLFSFIVAVLAGIVGVVSLTESRANTLIGVFISITTIPAAAGVGVFAAFWNATRALASFLQLLLNVVVLIVVGAASLRVQRFIWRRRTAHPSDRE